MGTQFPTLTLTKAEGANDDGAVVAPTLTLTIDVRIRQGETDTGTNPTPPFLLTPLGQRSTRTHPNSAHDTPENTLWIPSVTPFEPFNSVEFGRLKYFRVLNKHLPRVYSPEFSRFKPLTSTN